MIHSIKIEDNRKSAVHYIAELPQFANGTAYDFKEGVNIIVGENGSGKTTLLNIIRTYLLVDNQECSKGLFNCNINRIARHNPFDGVSVVADYKRNTFRLPHHDEEKSDDILQDAHTFARFVEQNSASTGEGVVIAINALFGYMFGKRAKLAFDYEEQFKDDYPEYVDYVRAHRRDGREWTVMMDEPDRNLSLENIDNIKCFLEYHKEGVQLIVTLHNPLLIYYLHRNFRHINWIEMSPGYVGKVVERIDELVK